MPGELEEAWRLAVALGIGLLIGAERERRMGDGRLRAFAGVRTFALTALLGGVAGLLGSVAVGVAAAFVAAAAISAYFLSEREDVGMTTEVAFVATLFLGVLAQTDPTLASAVGVVAAILLMSRETLHEFVGRIMSEQELRDLLTFAVAAVVILPLIPDRTIDPYGAVNLYSIWRLVVIVIGISGVGYVLVRALGPGYGLPLAGLAGGFVSSTATIGAMGTRARENPALVRPAIAAAVLSTVATVIQMAIVVGALSGELLRALIVPLACAGAVAVAYAAVLAYHSSRESGEGPVTGGRAFNLKAALAFGAIVAGVLFIAGAVNEEVGSGGLILAAALGGVADAHAAGIAVATIVASGGAEVEVGVVAILAGLTTNTASKMVAARAGGPWRYALPVWAGLIAVIAAAWGGWFLTLA